jgi:hypothetical protein
MTELRLRPRDFWRTSGFHLLARDADGHLVVTDDFLRAYYRRPEMAPVEGSCGEEIALHDALMADPRLVVGADRLALLADADARENYEVLLAFRDRLLAQPTIEACYLSLFRGGAVGLPPLFVNQLTHVIVRNILSACDDPFRVRAGELLFRTQMVNIDADSILLADEETVEMCATHGGLGAPGDLLEGGARPRSVELDRLIESNATSYWERSDRYDTVLDIGFGRPGLDALCRVFESWVRHLRGVEVAIHPVQAVRDERWVWHVGLDRESTGILNDLYDGREVEEARRARLLALFRLDVRDSSAMLPQVAGRPVYLGMAMTADKLLQLKPQNLIVNLPLKAAG